MTTDLVKGFRDYTGEEAKKRAEIRKILVETFEKYGFEPAETPIIENEEFVKGDNEKDEAVSDIFKLQDKGKRDLALRYELTFPLKRLAKNKKLPYRRYQIGEVFRDEPVSENRTRQFTSNDVDIIGSTIKDQAEILALADEILKKLNIKGIIYVNNRKLINEILDEQGIKDKENAIREIDKLDKIPEKNIKVDKKTLSIFKKPETYFKKYNSYKEIEQLKKYCKFFGVKIKFLPTLARGLSYYNGNIFEIKTKEIKETIFGGGAYTFNNNPSFGFGVSLERLNTVAKINNEKESYLIVSINKDKEAVKIAQKIREKGNPCTIFYRNPSKSLEFANSYQIKNVVFVGEKEVKSKKFKVKNMETGKESLLRI